jgi:RHS repeat-associated protein
MSGPGAWAVENYAASADEIGPDDAIVENGLKMWGHLATRGSTQSAGFVELNGDGLVDRAENGQVLINTGNGFTAAPDFVLPSTSLRETQSSYWATCKAPDPLPPGSTPYTSRIVRGYVDVNADGIADFWDVDKVHLGTGTGFAPPFELLSTVAPALSESSGTCGGAGVRTTAGLFDLDGDGRLDYVQVDAPNQRLRVFSIIEEKSLWGAVAAGRITEMWNGHGGLTKIVYRSLKRGTVAGHHVPFAEIAAVETSVERRFGGDGPDLERTQTASTGARWWFDHAADRWVFGGYERTTAVRGIAMGSWLWGSAVITDAWRPEDLPAGYQRNLLRGRPRRVATLAGFVPPDPSSLFAVDPTTDHRWSAQQDVEYTTFFRPLPGYTYPADDCASAAQPGEPSSYGLTHDDWDHACRTIGYAAVKSVTARRGKGAPASTVDDFVETKELVVAMDELARPTTIQHLGDTNRTDDDVCEVRAYAAAYAPWNVRNAVSSVRLLEPVPGGEFGPPTCNGASKIIAGARYRYDYYPEGVVAAGLPTADIVERRDPQSGALLDQWTAAVRVFDGMGNLLHVSEETGHGLARWTDISGYDAFGMAPEHVQVQGSDVATPIQTHYQHDPLTGAITAVTAPSGVVIRSQFDGFGRPTLSSFTDPRDGIEYATGLVEYLGATQIIAYDPPTASHEPGRDVIDPLGRRVRARRWHEPTPVAAVNPAATEPTRGESWAFTWLDYLGRPRYSERWLGADYAGARMIVGEVTRNTLGRVVFAADPYAAGAAGPRYGTTFFYDADGTSTCAVQGRGPQTQTSTSTADARFASCREIRYDAHQATVLTSSPNDLNPGAIWYGAQYETLIDAVGRVRRTRRMWGVTALERMDLYYDRLGHQTTINRFADPSGSAVVGWGTTYDSLGQLIRLVEPGTAPREMSYDRAGNQTELWWMDGGVRRSVRSSYDDLGRLVRSVETNNYSEDAASVANYFYDESSGEPFHAGTAYAAGRLTHAHSATQSVYLGYDPFGRGTFSAWVDQSGRRVERSVTSRPDGATTELRLRLPDTGWQDEIATYTYDSAQRLKEVRWRDENYPQGLVLYSVAQYDLKGRRRATQFGNGTDQLTSYRDADRDEITSDQVSIAGGTYAVAAFGFDADMRLTARTDMVGWSGRWEYSSYNYDAASRLASAHVFHAWTGVSAVNDVYTYDGLGTLTKLDDQIGTTRDFTAIPDTADRDRLCRVIGSGYPSSSSCSFFYDVLGNVTGSPLSSGWTRRIDYDNRGRMRTMRATFAWGTKTQSAWTYDPFGGVSTMDLWNSSSNDTRTDVRYGDAAEASDFIVNGAWQERFERRIPAGGMLVRKRGTGAAAKYLYTHADGRGTRVVTDQAGAMVQELDYYPFGEVRVDSAAPGNLGYSKYQFNGGDFARDFKVNVLGPRAYEARLGRFLQRDPLVIPRSSIKANPYAFAWGDPINNSDPTGLDPNLPDWCMGDECTGGGTGVSLAISTAAWLWRNGFSFDWPGVNGGSTGSAPLPPVPRVRLADFIEYRGAPSFLDDPMGWGRHQVADGYVGDALDGAGWTLGVAADGTAGFINGVSPVPIWDGPKFGHGDVFHGAQAAGAVAGLWYDVEAVSFGLGGEAIAIGCAAIADSACLPIAVPATALTAAGVASGAGHLGNLADSYDHFFRNESSGDGGGPVGVEVSNSAGDPVTRTYVGSQDELLAEANKWAGGDLANWKNTKPDWWESPDGRMRIEWNPAGHWNTNEGPHVTVRELNSEGRHGVVAKIFITGGDTFQAGKKFWTW